MAANWKMYKTAAETVAFFQSFKPATNHPANRHLPTVRQSSGGGRSRQSPR